MIPGRSLTTIEIDLTTSLSDSTEKAEINSTPSMSDSTERAEINSTPSTSDSSEKNDDKNKATGLMMDFAPPVFLAVIVAIAARARKRK